MAAGRSPLNAIDISQLAGAEDQAVEAADRAYGDRQRRERGRAMPPTGDNRVRERSGRVGDDFGRQKHLDACAGKQKDESGEVRSRRSSRVRWFAPDCESCTLEWSRFRIR